MRLVRVSYRVPPEPGGKERHVECLTREQLKRGHKVALAFRRGTGIEGSSTVGIRPTALSRVLAAKSDVLAFAAETAAVLRDVLPVDLVHVHGDHLEAAVLGPACRRLGIPLVLTVHGGLHRRHRRFAAWAFDKVSAFIAIGSGTAGDLIAAGADPCRILTISSGLDIAAIAQLRDASVRFAREPGLVVSAGSLEPVKNHALSIEAIHLLRRTRPEVRLVIAGDGPERARLERLAGVGEAVTLAGRLGRDDVYRLMLRAQVFLLASRRLTRKGEGVPTAALEALALGTPAVLSSDASLDPVVPDHGTYRTFSSGSVEDLATVLDAVLGDEEHRRRLSERGRRAVATLTWPAVTDRIEDWYRVVLDADRRGGVLP